MKSGFVELIIKNRLANKSLPNLPSQQRYQPVESFQKYINHTLPKWQQTIQINLLKKNLLKIKSEQVRKQFINAYLRRLFRLRQFEKDQIQSYKDLSQLQKQPLINIIDPTILKPIQKHSTYDIGSYIQFSNQDYNKVFKHGCFGNYSNKQYQTTQKFGIMIRKQSIGITNVMKIIQQKANAKDYWGELKTKNNEEKLQYINNQKIYPILFNDLSNHIYSIVKNYKDQQTFFRIWGSCVVSDTIVHSTLQNLDKIQNPFKFVELEIQQIMKMPIAPSPGDFVKRFKQLKCNQNITVKTQPLFFAKFNYQTPSFKNVFLGGQGGTGKSMILAYVAMWAHKNKWIVINVPSGYRWTNDRKAKYQRAYNGLYLIFEHGVQWLDQFKTCNLELLPNIAINMQKYGTYDITGTHQDQYEPVPNLWDQRRKVYFNEVGQKFDTRAVEKSKTQYEKQKAQRITDICKKPKSLIDIIDAGLQNPEYSICAMAQVLNQVYQSDELICQLVDSFSHFFRPCWYRSFRYFNDRGLFGHIPPYHIAHCRLFTHLDGHKLKNGFKAVASSHYPLYKHKFDIKKIMFPENYQTKIPNMTRDEFNKAGSFNILTQYWPADQIQRANMGYAYTISQGNWLDFQKTIRQAYYY